MQTSFSELEYASKKKQTQTRRDRFLAELEAVTPRAILVNTVAPRYPSGGGRGRPPIGLERMLRLYVAQQCFGLSDEGAEDALYDSQALLHGDETDVFGDAGYQGVEKREENLELPVTWHVAMRPGKRKALPKTAWGELLEKIEHAKAGIRAKVEHPFHVVKDLFHHRKTRYKGLVKNTAQLFSLFGLANLLLARRWLLNTHVQGAT